MVVPPGISRRARSTSTWIHWWSPVASANLSIAAWSTTIQSDGPSSRPTCCSRSLGYSTVSVVAMRAILPPRRRGPADVDAVLRPRGVEHLDRAEAGLGEEPPRRLFAPRGAEPRAALGEGDRHAVEHAHAVHVRRERTADVVLEAARRLGLDHEVDPVRRERGRDAAEHRRGIALVVDRVERRDQVAGRLGGQPGHVERLEARVGEPQAARLLAAARDRLLAPVVADEGRGRGG